MESLESRVEQLCAIINRTDNDNWDLKNKTVQTMTEIFMDYDREAFTPAVFRALKEPVKALVCDLRSQQVRDICALLSILAQVSGDKMKLFLRDSFPNILEGIKVPNKVMSGYVDECIFQMIKFTPFKTALPVLLQEVKENKSKNVREKCLDYLNEMLINWELTDREVDPLCEALKIGLEDASIKAREISRIAYGNFFLLFPAKAEKMRNTLPKPIQAKLLGVERALLETCVGEGGSAGGNEESHMVLLQAAAQSADEGSTAEDTQMVVVPERDTGTPRTPTQAQRSATPISTPAPSPAKETHAIATVAVTPSRPVSASSTASRSVYKVPASTVKKEREKEKEKEREREKEKDGLSESYQVLSNSTSATSFSTSVRGASSRRRSIVKNPFAELSDSFASSNREREKDRRPVSVPSSTSSPSNHRRSPSKDSLSVTKRSPARDSLQAQQWQPFSFAASSAGNSTASPRPSSVKRTTTPTQIHREREREREKTTPTHSRSRSAQPTSSAEKERDVNGERGRNGDRTPTSERRAVSANRAVVSVSSALFVDRDREEERSRLQHLQPLSHSIQTLSPAEIEVQREREREMQKQQQKVRSADRERERQRMKEREKEREKDVQIERERILREKEEALQREENSKKIPSDTRSAPNLDLAREIEREKDKDSNAFPRVGQRVIVTWGKDPVYSEIGVVRFFGLTLFATGLWVGVELEKEMGKNNGTVQGHYYFMCPPGYGLFVRKENVVVMDNNKDDDKAKKDSQAVEQAPSRGEESSEERMSERSTLLRSVSINGTTGARKKASVLKIKLSQMMNLLNQQLEIVEEIEQEEKKAAALSESLANPLAVTLSAVSTGSDQYATQEMARIQERLSELREEVDMITIQENDVIDGFRRRWKELL